MTDTQTKKVNPTNAVQIVEADDEVEIDLLELLYKLLDSWKTIAGATLVFALVAVLLTVFFMTPMYEATSTIYVLNRSDSAINFSDLQLGTALTKDYIKVFDMWEVHEEVISNLDLSYTYEDIEDMLSLTNESDTRMIDITITSPDPEEAAALANEYAQVASQYIADTMVTDKPSIMSVALVPVNPVSPNIVKNVLISFLLGAVLSCGVITVRFRMDDKYKTAEDIRKYTGMVTLAVVPKVATVRTRENSRRNV